MATDFIDELYGWIAENGQVEDDLSSFRTKLQNPENRSRLYKQLGEEGASKFGDENQFLSRFDSSAEQSANNVQTKAAQTGQEQQQKKDAQATQEGGTTAGMQFNFRKTNTSALNGNFGANVGIKGLNQGSNPWDVSQRVAMNNAAENHAKRQQVANEATDMFGNILKEQQENKEKMQNRVETGAAITNEQRESLNKANEQLAQSNRPPMLPNEIDARQARDSQQVIDDLWAEQLAPYAQNLIDTFVQKSMNAEAAEEGENYMHPFRQMFNARSSASNKINEYLGELVSSFSEELERQLSAVGITEKNSEIYATAFNYLQGRLERELVKMRMPQNEAEFAVRNAILSNSVGQMAYIVFAPSSMRKYDSAAMQEYGKDRPILSGVSAGVGIVTDPVLKGIGKGVGAAFKPIASIVDRGFGKVFGGRMLRSGFLDWGSKAVTKSLVGGLNFGLYEGFTSPLNHISSGEDWNIDDGLKAFVHGFTMGAITGVVGSVAEGSTRNWTSTAGRVGGQLLGLTAEAATFATAELVEMSKQGLNITVGDCIGALLKNSAMVASTKVANAVGEGKDFKQISKEFFNLGELSQEQRLAKMSLYDDTDVKEMTRVGVDPERFMELEEKQRVSPNKMTADETMELLRMYGKIQESNALYRTRAKTMFHIQKRIAPEPHLTDYIVSDDGTIYTYTTDATGKQVLVDEIRCSNKAAAERYAQREGLEDKKYSGMLQQKFNEYNQWYASEVLAAAAKEMGVAPEKILEAYSKQANGETLSAEESTLLAKFKAHAEYLGKSGALPESLASFCPQAERLLNKPYSKMTPEEQKMFQDYYRTVEERLAKVMGDDVEDNWNQGSNAATKETRLIGASGDVMSDGMVHEVVLSDGTTGVILEGDIKQKKVPLVVRTQTGDVVQVSSDTNAELHVKGETVVSVDTHADNSQRQTEIAGLQVGDNVTLMEGERVAIGADGQAHTAQVTNIDEEGNITVMVDNGMPKTLTHDEALEGMSTRVVTPKRQFTDSEGNLYEVVTQQDGTNAIVKVGEDNSRIQVEECSEEELNAMIANGDLIDPTQSNESVVETPTETPTETTDTTDVPAENVAPTETLVPVREDGSKEYTAAPVEATVTDLVNELGNDVALESINSVIDGINAELETLNGQSAPKTSDMNAVAQRAKEIRAKQNELQYWTDAKKMLGGTTESVEKDVPLSDDIAERSQQIMDIAADMGVDVSVMSNADAAGVKDALVNLHGYSEGTAERIAKRISQGKVGAFETPDGKIVVVAERNGSQRRAKTRIAHEETHVDFVKLEDEAREVLSNIGNNGAKAMLKNMVSENIYDRYEDIYKNDGIAYLDETLAQAHEIAEREGKDVATVLKEHNIDNEEVINLANKLGDAKRQRRNNGLRSNRRKGNSLDSGTDANRTGRNQGNDGRESGEVSKTDDGSVSGLLRPEGRTRFQLDSNENGTTNAAKQINSGDIEKLKESFGGDYVGKREQEAIAKFLNEDKDGAMVYAQLSIHNGTPWAKQAVNSILIRIALNDLMEGREPSVNSFLTHTTSKGSIPKVTRMIKGMGAEGLWSYLYSESDVIGNPSKCVNSVDGSYLNCRPSEDCAKFCYASKGNYIYSGKSIHSELVNWALRNNPKRLAEMIASEYKATWEYLEGKALRLFDKGDISEEWLPVIEHLNNDGIVCQIFSKRPEVIKRVNKDKNVVMMSVDKSNSDLLQKYPELPVAFVYTDKEDLTLLELQKDRFAKHGGSILPVKQGVKLLDEDKINALPKWANAYTCPIDKGTKKIGKNLEAGEWNCTRCDKGGGVGCFFSRTAKQLKEKYERENNQLRTTDDSSVETRAEGTGNERTTAMSATNLSERDLDIRGQLLSVIRESGVQDADVQRILLENLVDWVHGGLESRDGKRPEMGAAKDTDASGVYRGEGEERSELGRGNGNVTEESSLGTDESGTRMSLEEDEETLNKLESSEKVTGYRNVVLNEDGTLGSPMANRLRGEGSTARTSGFELGKWERADENPDLVDENGKITLVKPNSKTVGSVDYNPYIHNRPNKVNKQFKEAWNRPELVYVETEIAKFDLDEKYHADKAKKSTGIHSWPTENSKEKLILSRWDKPTRIVPWEEVADDWVAEFKESGVKFDIVPPALLPILSERGVEILPPTKGSSKECFAAYEKWKGGDGTKYAIPYKIGHSQTEEVANKIIDTFKKDATQFNKIEISPENWLRELGKDNSLHTPIGDVKFGGNQYAKLDHLGRSGKLGMIKPTLTDPDFIIEDESGDENSERNTSNIYVKSFVKNNGERMYLFTSVTIRKGGNEISISNQEKSENRVRKLLTNGKLIYVREKEGLWSASESQMGESVHFNDSQTATKADNNSVSLGINSSKKPSSAHKGTTSSATDQTNVTKKSLNRDEEYAKAVESGNVEKQNELVKAAAKAAMPETKVVDENGEPLVVYHGTNSEPFHIFDKEKQGTSAGSTGGFYFSNTLGEGGYSESEASMYGKNVMKVFLDIKHPISETDKTLSKEDFRELYRKVSRKHGYFSLWDFDDLYEQCSSDGELFSGVTGRHPINGITPQENAELWKSIGYDGLIYKYGSATHYQVFESNQIKSADPITRDDNGNVIPLSERFNSESEDIRFSFDDTPNFVSNAAKAVENVKQEKANASQWLAMLEKSGGIKAGEDKWLGLRRWLGEQGALALAGKRDRNITKAEILDYIAENNIQIEEVKYTPYGEQDDAIDPFNPDAEIEEAKEINQTRLEYTTKGLENKKEIALVVPTIEPYNENDRVHFGDAGGGRAVAWVRFGDATDAEGNKVLVIDEIQSKRHQDGREKGYIDNNRLAEITNRVKEMQQEMYDKLNDGKPLKGESYYDAVENMPKEFQVEHNKLKEEYWRIKNLIPDAPFDKNWHELAMKRMLRYAAENGYDKVAWTTGAQQADRYDMREQVREIQIKKKSYGGGYQVVVKSVDGGNIFDDKVEDAQALTNVLGKELATSLIEKADNDPNTIHIVDGDGLKVGGEGMKGFYDKMLPSFMSKYGKKWGAKVGEVELDLPNEGDRKMWSVDVTDAMKESLANEPQTMFSLDETQEAVNAPELTEENEPKGAEALILDTYKQLEGDRERWAEGVRKFNDVVRNKIKKAVKGLEEIKVDESADAPIDEFTNDIGKLGEQALNALGNYKLSVLYTAADLVKRLNKDMGAFSAHELNGILADIKKLEGTNSVHGLKMGIAKIYERFMDKRLKFADENIVKAAKGDRTVAKAGNMVIKNLDEYANEGLDLVRRMLWTTGHEGWKEQSEDTINRFKAELEELRAQLQQVENATVTTPEEKAAQDQTAQSLRRRIAYRENYLTRPQRFEELVSSVETEIEKMKELWSELNADPEKDPETLHRLNVILPIVQEMQTFQEQLARINKDISTLESQLAETRSKWLGANNEERQKIRKSIFSITAGILDSKDELLELKSGLAEKLMDYKNTNNVGDAHRNTVLERQNTVIHAFRSDFKNINQRSASSNKKNPHGKENLGMMATFANLMELFGRHATDGRGAMYRHFVPMFIKSRNTYIEGMEYARERMSDIATEALGKGNKRSYKHGKRNWIESYAELAGRSDIKISDWAKKKKMRPLDIIVTDIDESINLAEEWTVGNLLYILAVNKQEDGRMKLLNMGIDDKMIDQISNWFDSDAELVAMRDAADKIQHELIPELLKKWQKTHKDVFGVGMKANENYFKLNIDKSDLDPEGELGSAQKANPSNITGSLITRTKNTKRLNITGSNFFDVAMEHIQEMEDWNAFCRFREDCSTLIHSKAFKNKLNNINGLFGSGEALFNTVLDACNVACGLYSNKTEKAFNALDVMASTVVGMHIKLNPFPALKQTTSIGFALQNGISSFVKAFINDNKTFLKRPGSNIQWAEENLPIFRERRRSGDMGYEMLKDIESDSAWLNLLMTPKRFFDRYGISANRFVDLWVCSVVARAEYEYAKKAYKALGYSDAEIEEHALIDAAICFNESQQSSEAAFLSRIQKQRDFFKGGILAYQNSPFAYARLLWSSSRNMMRYLKDKPEDRVRRRQQALRLYLDEGGTKQDQFKKNWKKHERHNILKNICTFAAALSGYFLYKQFSNYVYSIFGDDNDKRKENLRNSAILTGVNALTSGIPYIGLGADSFVDALLRNGATKDAAEDIFPTTFLTEWVGDSWKYLGYGIANKDVVDICRGLSKTFGTPLTGIDFDLISNMATGALEAFRMDAPLTKKLIFGTLALLNSPRGVREDLMIDEMIEPVVKYLEEARKAKLERGDLEDMLDDFSDLDPKAQKAFRDWMNNYVKFCESRNMGVFAIKTSDVNFEEDEDWDDFDDEDTPTKVSSVETRRADERDKSISRMVKKINERLKKNGTQERLEKEIAED